MTLQELFNLIGENPIFVIVFFAGLPILSLLMTWITGEESYKSPWNYVYSALIYAVCIPGIFAVTLILYTMLFEGKSLLEVNLFVYFLPIISMIVSLLILSRKLHLENIPGFDKLSGLISMIVVTLMTILLIQKTRIWVVFYGSVWYLIALFAGLFIMFKIGFKRLFSKS